MKRSNSPRLAFLIKKLVKTSWCELRMNIESGVRHIVGKPTESQVQVWTDFYGGRRRGSGKAEAETISMNIIHITLVCMAPPYEIHRYIKPYSCSTAIH